MSPTGGGLATRRRAGPRRITPGTIITSDQFGGGNVANINGRALDLGLGGSAKTWAQVAGTTNGLGITSGAVTRQATGNARRYNFDTGVGDLYASIKVVTRPTVASAFLVVRGLATNTDTFYSVRFSTTAAVLHKHVAGVLTTLGSSIGIVDGQTVSILVRGTQLMLGVDGYLRSVVTDTDVPDTQHGAGLAVTSTSTGFAFDDLIIANPL